MYHLWCVRLLLDMLIPSREPEKGQAAELAIRPPFQSHTQSFERMSSNRTKHTIGGTYDTYKKS